MFARFQRLRATVGRTFPAPRRRARRSADGIADLDETVAAAREAVDRDPDHPGKLSLLASRLHACFEQNGQGETLDEAVATSRRAVRATAPDDAGRGARFAALAVALSTRFSRTGDLADLDDAVDAARTWLTLAPDGHPARLEALGQLSELLSLRYQTMGEPADLNDARTAIRLALAVPGADRPAWLTELCGLLAVHAERGNASAASMAITAGRRAEADLPAEHPAYPRCLAYLSHAYQARYQVSGDQADLDEALKLIRRALDVAVADDPMMPVLLLNHAGIRNQRFESRNDVADLDEAIAAGRKALAGFSPPAPQWILASTHVGNALRGRYERTGELADLDEAVAVFKTAAAAVPGGHPRRGGHLSNVGQALLIRYARTHEPGDLDEAVEILREAIETEEGRRSPEVLTNLGLALLGRYLDSHRVEDLARSIALLREAVDRTPQQHPRHTLVVANLGAALRMWHLATHHDPDLDATVETLRGALSLTPADHPRRLPTLLGLGAALRDRFEHGGQAADLDEAIAVMRDAAQVETGTPGLRMLAAHDRLKWAAERGDWNQALEAAETGVRLLPELASADLDRRTRQHWLARIAGLARDAAACALQVGNRELAITLAEQGRATLLSEALSWREDLTELRAQAPELAERYLALRAELHPYADAGASSHAPSPAADTPVPGGDPGTRRRKSLAVLDQTLAEIRRRPGFSRFRLPSEVGDVRQDAQAGPIVLVNISRHRSDAVLITAAGDETVGLDHATPAAVFGQAEKLRKALRRSDHASATGDRDAQLEAQADVDGVLSWLWNEITGPVLDRLALAGDLERVWWIPSGLLGLLPLHAARHGDHNALDLVVSSYIPTIRALRHARARPGSGLPRSMLAVAMPETPDAHPLPYAADEIQAAAEHFARNRKLTADEAVYDRVRTLMSEHPWVHFACHGTSDLTDPSAGRLLLSDHETRPLTAAAVAGFRLEQADFAFLSACETARPGDRLADEAIHLASAFLAAGYRHVVATLWRIRDDIAFDLARAFYDRILADGQRADPATALHQAALRIRDEFPDCPSWWASHIHTGA